MPATAQLVPVVQRRDPRARVATATRLAARRAGVPGDYRGERLGGATTLLQQADRGECSLMHIRLHANTTTTARTRAYIQRAPPPLRRSREVGIHRRTVARWRARHDAADRSTRPHRLATTISAWEEALILELCRSLALPHDDIVAAMRRGVNPKLSRSRHSPLPQAAQSLRPPHARQGTGRPLPNRRAGFIHIDVKYRPPLGRRSSAYSLPQRRLGSRSIAPPALSISKSSPRRHRRRFSRALSRPLPACRPHHPRPAPGQALTDNGSEFTDRFAVDKKAKPRDKPSGTHAFERLCAERAITHRLTRPFRPQTNGLVERFNRRLGEHLDRLQQNRAAHHRRFVDHTQRDAYLHTFVADDNRTRLRCLDYQAPAELLANSRDTTPSPGKRGGVS